MELIGDSPFRVAWLAWPVRPPQPSLLVVAKATFDLVERGECTFAEQPQLPTGDRYDDDDPERSVVYDSDFALIKPRGEVFVTGHAHAATEQAVVLDCELAVGPVRKPFRVTGDRFWTDALGGVTSPTPFQRMSLAWERSFWGADNPAGRGITAERVGGSERIGLPNVEHAARPIRARDERPAPYGVAPIARTWPTRTRHLGTYDDAWRAKRWPWLPDDFSWEHFQAAPEDQQIEGYWKGDEAIELAHLHPRYSRVKCRLPGRRPHVYVKHHEQEELVEVPLLLDTLVVDADAGQVLAVWRGLTDLPEDEGLDAIEHVFATEHGVLRDLPLDAATSRYRKARMDADGEDGEDGEDDVALPWERAAQEDSTAPEPDAAGDAALPDEDDDEDEPDEPTDDVAALSAALAEHGVAPAAMQGALRQLERASQNADPSPAAPKLEALNAQLEAMGFEPIVDDVDDVDDADDDDDDEDEENENEDELSSTAEDEGDDTVAPASTRRAELLAAHAHGVSCAEWDLAGEDLSDLELAGIDLSRAILTEADLTGTDLDGATLDGAQMSGAKLDAAGFVGASMKGCDLSGVSGRAVVLDQADLTDAVARRAELPVVSLRGSTLVRADFSASDLSLADFEQCRADELDLSRCNLQGARFIKANLRDAWFSGVSAPGAVFDDADVSLLRADEEGDFLGASFARVQGEGARFSGSSLGEADLSFSKLDGADFTDASLTRAKLMSCHLSRACFRGADLRAASLIRSDVLHGVFEAADLRGADLRGCNLFGAELWRAELDGTQLALANLNRTKLEGQEPR